MPGRLTDTITHRVAVFRRRYGMTRPVHREAAVIELREFERLRLTVAMIATRREDQRKRELVREYMDVIEARWREGRLSFVQWAGLVAVLLAGHHSS